MRSHAPIAHIVGSILRAQMAFAPVMRALRPEQTMASTASATVGSDFVIIYFVFMFTVLASLTHIILH